MISRINVRMHPYLDILVSSAGEIWVPQTCKSRKSKWFLGNLIPCGYRQIQFNKKRYMVHRLVAETFLPNPNGYTIVDHIDRNRQNNDVSNLRWANYSINALNTKPADDCVKKYGLHSTDDRIEWQRRYRSTEEGRARIRQYNLKAKMKRKEAA